MSMQLGLEMARFSKVSAAFWRSKRVAKLSDQDRLALLYFLTAEHQTAPGVARIPAMYAASDLRWTEAQFTEARQRLVRAGLLLFDEDTDEHFPVGWFQFNAPNGPKHELGMRRQIGDIKSAKIRMAAEDELDAADKPAKPDPSTPRRPRTTNRDPDYGKLDPGF